MHTVILLSCVFARFGEVLVNNNIVVIAVAVAISFTDTVGRHDSRRNRKRNRG